MDPAAATPRVFVSATTADLGALRGAVAEELRLRDVHAIEQRDFPTDHRSVACILEDRIRSCHAVIHLVGSRYGGEPALRPPEAVRRSFSQMEYDAAVRLGKPVFVFVADEGRAAPEPLPPEPDELRALQASHRDEVCRRDEAWYRFADEVQLRELVRRIPTQRLCPPIVLQNLPYCSLGPLFVGRDRELAELGTRTGLPDGAARFAAGPVAIVATGGAGKTRLSVEFAWRALPAVSACLFVSAASPERLRQTLAGLAVPGVLGLPGAGDRGEPERFDDVMSWLGAHRSWLLILDDVDSAEAADAVVSLLPRLHAGTVLVTTRQARWPPSVSCVELPTLEREHAASFLLARTAPARSRRASDLQDALALAESVGGLPLALEQAGAYMMVRRCSLSDCLSRWTAREPELLGEIDPRVSAYPVSVAVAWDASLEQLSFPAQVLLSVVAWFDHAPIPMEIFERLRLNLDSQPTVGSRLRGWWRRLGRRGGPGKVAAAGDASGSLRYRGKALPLVLELEALSLVRRTTDGDLHLVHLHRVLQDVIRARPRVLDRDRALRVAAHVLTEGLLDASAPERRRFVEVLLPHATHLERELAHPEHAGTVGRLFERHSHALFSLRRIAESEAPGREAVRWLRQSGDPHALVLSLSNLATTLGMIGKSDEALALANESVERATGAWGAGSPEAAVAEGALAPLLADAGRVEDAERMIDALLARLPESDASTAARRGGLCRVRADVLLQAGRLEEARAWYRRALAALGGASGSKATHERAECHGGLAAVAYGAKDLDAAATEYTASLAAMGTGAVEESADYGRREMHLGNVLVDLGRTADAIRRLAHATEVLARCVGPSDAVAVLCRTRLASACLTAGQYELAARHAEMVLDIAWPVEGGPGRYAALAGQVLVIAWLLRKEFVRIVELWDQRVRHMLASCTADSEEEIMLLRLMAGMLRLVDRSADARRAIEKVISLVRERDSDRASTADDERLLRAIENDARRTQATRPPGTSRNPRRRPR